MTEQTTIPSITTLLLNAPRARRNLELLAETLMVSLDERLHPTDRQLENLSTAHVDRALVHLEALALSLRKCPARDKLLKIYDELQDQRELRFARAQLMTELIDVMEGLHAVLSQRISASPSPPPLKLTPRPISPSDTYIQLPR